VITPELARTLSELSWDTQRQLAILVDRGGNVRYVVVGGLLLVALVAAHLWLPRQHPPRLRLWPGITATLVLWWVVTGVFAGYLESFANYTATYAGLATVVAAIFYLWLMAVILIAGAEFNAAIAAVRDESAAKVRQSDETARE
jgi:membrane protein